MARKPNVEVSDLDLATIITRSETMKTNFSAKYELCDELEAMYRLEWTDKPTEGNIKETMSVEPHSVVNAICRILSTAEPSITVPPLDKETGTDKKEANDLEKSLRTMMQKSDRQTNASLVGEVVAQLAIWSECCIKVWDMRPMAQRSGKKMAKFPKQIMPIALKTIHPTSIAYESADWGIARVVESRKRTLGDVRSSWRLDALEFPGEDSMEVTFNEYWDWTPFDDSGTRAVWLSDFDSPILKPHKHKLDFMPYIIRFGHGLSFLTNVEDRRMSILYPLLKTKTWHRLNLLLTLMSTNVFLFSNPHTIISIDPNHDREVTIDASQLGGQTKLYTTEKIEPFARQLIPPEANGLLSILSAQSQKSTLPDVVQGGAPGGITAGYAINLLAQGGKLAIFPIERAANTALTDVLDTALGWIADSKYTVTLAPDQEITARIADTYRQRVEVKLNQKMPMDKAAIAQMWNMMISGNWGSPEKAWEELGYTDTDAMMRSVLDWLHMKKYVDEYITIRGKESGAEKELERVKQVPSSVLPPQMQGQPVPAQPPPAPAVPPPGQPTPEDLAALMGGGGIPPGVPQG